MEHRPDFQPPPRNFEDRPALELAWRGLVISIGAGQMTRAEAVSMLDAWDIDPAQLTIEDIDNGTAATA